MDIDLLNDDPRTRAFQSQVLEYVERQREDSLSRFGRRSPEHSTTAIIGSMGSGKTALACRMLSQKYMQGYDVYSTSESGFRFGRVIELDELPYLFTLGSSFRECYFFIDEITVYHNRFRQMSSAQVMLDQSLAALRKNKIHLIYSAQKEHLIAGNLRDETRHVFNPYPAPFRRMRRKRGRKWEYRNIAVPGRVKELKITVGVLRGERTLSYFEDRATTLMRLIGKHWTRPKMTFWRVPYVEMAMAASLYDTYAALNIGASMRVNADHIRQAMDGDAPEPEEQPRPRRRDARQERQDANAKRTQERAEAAAEERQRRRERNRAEHRRRAAAGGADE